MSKRLNLDGDRVVGLRNQVDGSYQVELSMSGTSTRRARITHTPCKCGKGRTTVRVAMSDEALEALMYLYLSKKPIGYVQKLVGFLVDQNSTVEAL
jgi:hypothetical protein